MSGQLAMDFGAKKRDAGMADAISGFALSMLRTAITLAGAKHTEFTSDDVWNELTPGVKMQLELRPNALGAALRSAAVDHVIIATERMRKSSRPDARKRKITVWRLA